jgi:vancomycin resistance protein YoaR
MLRSLFVRPNKATGKPLAAMLVLGGIAGFFAVPPAPPVLEKRPVPSVVLAGSPIPIEDPNRAIVSARSATRQYLRGKIRIVGPGGVTRDISRAELGARLDEERLVNVLAQARDPESAMRKRATSAIVLPMPVRLSENAAMSALLQIKDEIDREPIEARFDAAAHAMMKESSGLRIDVDTTLSRLANAIDNGQSSIDAAYDTLSPKRNLQVGGVSTADVLGYFETRYTPDKKHEARSFNLKLAASKLDGYVVLPGEEFDFNQVVGPRSEAYGYRAAPVIAEGELADGIGGGTCQIAGTLHAAVTFAGLPIVERHPHTRPSYYIKMGLDAAVAYPTLSLRFRNDFDFPIVIHESVQHGIVRAEILGSKRTRDVAFLRIIDEAIPFQEREVNDPDIPRGRRVLGQRGIPGFRLHKWRLVKDHGMFVSMDGGAEGMSDKYPPTTQVWHVGTGPFRADDPTPDEHPEYVADEWLNLMQGPAYGTSCGSRWDPACTTPVSTPGGGAIEMREPGHFGNYGWTRRFMQTATNRATPSG